MSGISAHAHKGELNPLSEEELAKFCEFFYRKTGITFSESKRYFIERRIQDRIQKTESNSFRDYFSLIRFQASGEEVQRLINTMTINETYFFREDYQLDALVRGILPELARKKRPSDTIRIWSLPCATGEEPYSLAIYILDRWSRADDFAIEILASDIDTRVLAEAYDGVYGERALQKLSADERQRYFTRLGADRYRMRDEIRESIDFSTVNVVDPSQMRRYRNIDVIFCRNMLIYFDDISRRLAMDAMYECLSPGGFICLGHSESMSRISSLLKPRKFFDNIVYQKAPTGE
jgi:chemotaxis protein methyltransferase CheR